MEESTILALWNDVKNGGTSLYILLFFLLLYFLKPYVNSILVFVGKLIRGKVEKKTKEYTIADVRNHPIFKDLDFWLDIGIKSLKMNNININYPLTRVVHKESEDYLKAKEEIAKDILTIKFSVVKEYLHLFLEENPLENIDLETVKTYFGKYVAKCEIKQYNEMLEAKIPEEFLKKYYIYERMALDLLKNNMEGVLSTKAFDLSPISRIYLAFTALNNYLAESYNTMLFTVFTINGDLNGVEYKGNIIGEAREELLQPPNSAMVIPAIEKLNKIMYEFGASRALLIRYFEKNKELYHSAVYEVCDTGITSVIDKIQNISSMSEMDTINLLKNDTIISVEISKFNNHLMERLSSRGDDAIVIVPILEHDDLIGILVLDYISVEEFNSRHMEQHDKKLKEYAKDLMPYISYPEDYNF